VEDIYATLYNEDAPLVGLRDPKRLNAYLARCDSSSSWQKWTIDNSTGLIKLVSKPDFTLGKGKK